MGSDYSLATRVKSKGNSITVLTLTINVWGSLQGHLNKVFTDVCRILAMRYGALENIAP